MADAKPYTFDRVVRIFITVGLLLGLVLLLRHLSDVLIPFAVALLLAYLINPLVLLVQSRVRHRLAAVLISLMAVLGALTLLSWLVLPMIGEEIQRTGDIVSNLVNNSQIAAEAAKRLPPDLWQAVKDLASRKDVQDFFRTDSFWKIMEAVGTKLLPGVWGLITGTASVLMGLLGMTVIGLYLVFLLLDYQKFAAAWREMLPPAHKETITGFAGDFGSAMNRYFRAQAAVASIVGVLFAIGFWLIDLPMGILLGLFIGLLNMVPYLQIVGLIPAFALAVVRAIDSGSSIGMSLLFTGVVFIVVQLLQDMVLVPRITGKIMRLSPAVILLSLSIWGKLLGVFGLLIALPMTCLVLAYYQRFLLSQGTGASSSPSGVEFGPDGR